jgi:hypothetical protein
MRQRNKTNDEQESIWNFYIDSNYSIPSKEDIIFLEGILNRKNDREGRTHICIDQRAFKMIHNECNNTGFGKIDQRNHLGNHTRELIHLHKLDLKMRNTN